MGRQQKQNETHHTERQAVLSGLDAKIDGFDVAIAGLIAEKHALERARKYIVATHDATAGGSHDNTALTDPSLKLHMRPTYPSLFHQARKARSCLRQDVLIRNAMDREKSSSPPGSVGLLSSDEFEASFPNHNMPSGNDDGNGGGRGADNGVGDDVRPSVERMSSSTAENYSARSPTTTSNALSRSTTPSPFIEIRALSTPSRNGQGAHWQAKRVTKRKLQENAAKAREVRRRRLNEATSAKL